jgi:AAA ATPase domain
MDPRTNPYTPNAGARPPALVGRDGLLETFDILLHRLQAGRSEQSLLITGLRGVGKTVLLRAFEERARLAGWVTADSEITKSADFGPRMAVLCRRALLELAPKERWRERARRAAGVLRSFSITVTTDGAVTASLDVDPVAGMGDSGDLGDDLTDVLVTLGEAAQESRVGVVFLLDEVQFLEPTELEALITALHMVVQRELPVTLVGAGLPQLPRLAGEAKSYAERLFKTPSLGPLSPMDSEIALTQPANELGVAIEARAVQTVVAYTEGYPYFIQEYGKALWDRAQDSPITAIEAVEAQALVEAVLDGGLFRVRLERASASEIRYLRAMAELGAGPQRAADVAGAMGRRSQQVAPTRARLLEKGLLYSPSYGLAAFSVPQFDRYMRRTYPSTLISGGGSSRSSRSG